MRDISKKIHSAGFVDPDILCVRPIGLRRFDSDFIAITVAGEAFFVMKELGISSPVKEISLVYVPAGKKHIYDPRNRKNWKNFWVLFDHDAVASAFRNLLPKPGITTLSGLKQIRRHWEKMILCTLEQYDSADDHAFCMLHNILYEANTLAVTSDTNTPSAATRNTLDVMHSNLREAELNFETIAMNHGICLDTLRKRFKKETRVSLHQYFIQLKINAAKTMLANLSYNVSDIAVFLGFEDPYYFSRLFKRKTGVSPKKFRDELARKRPGSSYESGSMPPSATALFGNKLSPI
jgi:AraC-like DNA-binding protein